MSIKKEVNYWDEAIADARQKLIEGKAYVKRLRLALRILERNKETKVPLSRVQSCKAPLTRTSKSRQRVAL
jgi:hypothetical protein